MARLHEGASTMTMNCPRASMHVIDAVRGTVYKRDNFMRERVRNRHHIFKFMWGQRQAQLLEDLTQLLDADALGVASVAVELVVEDAQLLWGVGRALALRLTTHRRNVVQEIPAQSKLLSVSSLRCANECLGEGGGADIMRLMKLQTQ